MHHRIMLLLLTEFGTFTHVLLLFRNLFFSSSPTFPHYYTTFVSLRNIILSKTDRKNNDFKVKEGSYGKESLKHLCFSVLCLTDYCFCKMWVLVLHCPLTTLVLSAGEWIWLKVREIIHAKCRAQCLTHSAHALHTRLYCFYHFKWYTK